MKLRLLFQAVCCLQHDSGSFFPVELPNAALRVRDLFLTVLYSDNYITYKCFMGTVKAEQAAGNYTAEVWDSCFSNTFAIL